MYDMNDIQIIKEHFITQIWVHRLIILVLVGIIVKLLVN